MERRARLIELSPATSPSPCNATTTPPATRPGGSTHEHQHPQTIDADYALGPAIPIEDSAEYQIARDHRDRSAAYFPCHPPAIAPCLPRPRSANTWTP